MTLKRIFLPVTWAVLLGWIAFIGFIAGVTRERERWSVAIGACELPATKLDALLIMRSESGTLYCQPRMR